MIKKTLLSTALSILCLMAGAQAHPADQHVPEDLPRGYGTESYGFGLAFDINELYFPLPFPDPISLTDAEKYIIAGTKSSSDGASLRPWYSLVFNAVATFYQEEGYVPDRLDENVLKAISSDPSAFSGNRLNEYRSPITDEFPLLKSEQFSRGNVYIRPLDEAEMRFFASKSSEYQRIWFEGRQYNPMTDEWENAQLLTDVFYIRVYGEDEVIHAGIHFHSASY